MSIIDLHCHILPGMDDGAQNLRESLDMASLAVEGGTKVMVATPHCKNGGAQTVREEAALLRQALRESGIPLQLCVGMEIFGTPDTALMLKDRELLTLHDSAYPLIEFAFDTDGRQETWILEQIIDAGYIPLVAHPERYRCIQEDPGLVNAWKEMGCLFQVNRGSLLGRFGLIPQKTALVLTRRGFTSVVASDAHSVRYRTPWMQDVENFLNRKVSPVAADYLLRYNPVAILKNEQLLSVEPEWF